MADRNAGAPCESWSAAEWAARAEHARRYLETDPKWKVGPDVVAMYERGAERARARETAAATESERAKVGA